MKNNPFIIVLLAVILLFLQRQNIAVAHPLSAAFTNIKISNNVTELTYSIDSLSVIEGIGGDKNEDGELTEKELKPIANRVEEWVEDSLVLEMNDQQQTAELDKLYLEKRADKAVVTLQFKLPGFEDGQTVRLLDGIFTSGNTASSYTNFLTINYDGQISESVIQGKNREWTMLLTANQQEQQSQSASSDSTTQTIPNQHPDSDANHDSWTSFFVLGMNHILTGYDHLLFLLALLIRKQSFKQYAALITAFTLAHSVTLTLSVLGLINLPSNIVEPLIALSICYVALENIFRKEIKFRWIITFLFGLIHGMGFASLLKEMTLPKEALASSLISFNAGIEIVQLAIVLLLLPLLAWFQRSPSYKKGMVAGSILILVMGGFWLIQRLIA
ncbi:HupE/UreJ family protein [Fictibacillus barbaricus]|uniref:Hydrogenase/urease accessory protein HupE n=1 Tax=Fictibacillus barbaricus TaxID=182136 RepID=A0ABU1U190_9BACL|nr:HupE/UreJ family protein [Fictibacillus barbaricus]MDR7073222.1 hydrogenase/urease accessory protein HupE [Fictibacillus barbaricus]